MKINAYAKINLFLDVMEKRPDGFHNIRSIMHRVSLCDVVKVDRLSDCGREIKISCASSSVPQGEGNLVWKAAKLFFDFFAIEEYNVSIEIEKRIPISAGLAGGSADAAATLVALNKEYGINADTTTLCVLGAKLGSDVPFCINGRTSLTTGRGEVMQDVESNLELILVIAKGGEGVSTPSAYRRIDERFGDTLCENFADLDGALNAVKSGSMILLAETVYNTFEEVVLPEHAEASRAKAVMLENGAVFAMLSGSGPSVFGAYENTADAERVCAKLSAEGYEAHVCFSLK